LTDNKHHIKIKPYFLQTQKIFDSGPSSFKFEENTFSTVLMPGMQRVLALDISRPGLFFILNKIDFGLIRV
jgi:hypothetical protein